MSCNDCDEKYHPLHLFFVHSQLFSSIPISFSPCTDKLVASSLFLS